MSTTPRTIGELEAEIANTPRDAMREAERLRRVNAELLAALRPLVRAYEAGIAGGTVYATVIETARSAIAKAERKEV